MTWTPHGRAVLITGGTGSLGRVLVKRMLDGGAREVRVLSRDEYKQHRLRETIRDIRLRFEIGDIRDLVKVDAIMRGVDVVINAAALKNVVVLQDNPVEAIRTNVCGAENVIASAFRNAVECVVMISTDKAVQPISVMGMSKALMERMSIVFGRNNKAETRVVVVRYGNVIDSRGSALHMFASQCRNGLPLTLTDERMTRFVTKLSDASDFVMSALSDATSGETWVKKCSAARIVDLIDAVKTVYGRRDLPTNLIGRRPGDKLHEVLLHSGEKCSAVEMEGGFRIPTDAPFPIDSAGDGFSSDTVGKLTAAELELLVSSVCLDAEIGFDR